MQIIRTVHIALIATLVLGPSQPAAHLVSEAGSSSTRIDVGASIGETSVSATLTPAERQLVESATQRFALVGLDLPDVEVSFHDDIEACGWNEGIYHGNGGVHQVQVCVRDRGTFASDLNRSRTLIHELAHAWEQASLDDTDRHQLLSVLDAEAWVTSDLAWEDRGAERFAETIVWGLYDQLRRPILISGSCAELHADFQLITGYSAPGPLEPVCALDMESPISSVRTSSH